MDDALVVYAQNGEALRPAAGYPVRLLLPGWEGNANVKWLRRLELIAQPNMSRDETSKYTDPLPNGTARQFSFVMDVKSIITRPSHPARLERDGWAQISGIAWSGRGKIAKVEVSTDAGVTWAAAELQEPVLSKAARKLGVDQVELRKINAPAGKAPFGPALPNGRQAYVTSAFVKEALDKGREMFEWERKKASSSGKRQGNKARGIGVAVSPYAGGSIGFDGLFIIKPDGRVTIQSGIGNHGTHSAFDVHRQAAQMLGVPWDKCDVVFGNTSKNLPWTCVSAGSQTAHAMTRAAHAAATDAIKKLQEIAAKTHGGSPDSYKVANERVSGPGGSMTLAQAAQKAIEYGGRFDGHELPEDINSFTKTSAKNLAGQGLMAVAKDAYPRDGQSQSYVIGFAEVEVDTETGVVKVLDYAAVGDVGTILNPRGLKGQLFGGSMLGLGHAITQRWAYDQHYGVALARRFHHNKPPTILDAPGRFTGDAVNLPDPETPTGVRGVGEPPVGAAYGAIMNAIADAVGDEIFRRSPVSADMILNALENGGNRTHEALTAHI